jgi:Skp family chaperone for outer membrane proteins
MRVWLVLVALLLGQGLGLAQGTAQTVPVVPDPVLTIDQERIFSGSAYGRAALARQDADEAALVAENRKIEAALEEEERGLTARRATLPAAEFRSIAAAFDKKVEEIRSAQDAKSRALTQQRDAERQRFLQVAVPVIGDLMRDMGAVAILDKQAIFLSFERIDITDAAIVRLDAKLGDGSTVPAPDPAQDPSSKPPVQP